MKKKMLIFTFVFILCFISCFSESLYKPVTSEGEFNNSLPFTYSTVGDYLGNFLFSDIESINNGKYIAVSSELSNCIIILDNELNKILKIDIDSPKKLLFDKTTNNLYVTQPQNDTISVINVTNWIITKTIRVWDYPVFITQNTTSLFVSFMNQGDGFFQISKISNNILKSFKTNSDVGDLVFDKNHNHLYLLTPHEKKLMVYSLSSEEIIDNVILQNNPKTLCLIPYNRLLVSDITSNLINVINTDTREITNTFNISNPALQMLLSPDSQYVYISTKNSILVYETTNLKYLGEFRFENTLENMEISDDGKYIFVSIISEKLSRLESNLSKIELYFNKEKSPIKEKNTSQTKNNNLSEITDKKVFLINEIPNNSGSYYLERAKYYLSQEEYLLAKLNAYQALEIYKNENYIQQTKKETLKLLGILSESTNKPKEAITFFERAYEIDKNDFLTVSKLINYYWNDPEKSEKLLEIASATKNSNDIDFLKYAVLIKMKFYNQIEVVKIIQDIKRIVDLYPEYISKLTESMNRQSPEIVKELYEIYLQEIKNSPDDYTSNFVAGYWEYSLYHKMFRAVNHLSTSYGLNPDNHYAFYLVGSIMLEEDFNDGSDKIKTAIELEPDFPFYYFELAKAYKEHHNESENPMDYVNNGIIYAEMGYSLNPFNEEMKELLNDLYALKINLLDESSFDEQNLNDKKIELLEKYIQTTEGIEQTNLTEKLKKVYSQKIEYLISTDKVQEAINLAEKLN